MRSFITILVFLFCGIQFCDAQKERDWVWA